MDNWVSWYWLMDGRMVGEANNLLPFVPKPKLKSCTSKPQKKIVLTLTNKQNLLVRLTFFSLFLSLSQMTCSLRLMSSNHSS